MAADHDNEYMMIDSTTVRAHQQRAGARKKERRSGHQTILWWPDYQNPCHLYLDNIRSPFAFETQEA
ncbi:hypothetical protein EOV40_014180 (plasmid) [Acetobacter oryzoeni]|uniref:Transposase n=1 Tax=Acetobacter oryzoeni TaxID=2500548 RepID=A0A5B9GTL9_9PROT|nr:hypothetical protein EOV40_014180 [Acetobacter oryzoeni]